MSYPDAVLYTSIALLFLSFCIYFPIIIYYDRKKQLLPNKIPIIIAASFGVTQIAAAIILADKFSWAIVLGFLPINVIFILFIYMYSAIWRKINKKLGYQEWTSRDKEG